MSLFFSHFGVLVRGLWFGGGEGARRVVFCAGTMKKEGERPKRRCEKTKQTIELLSRLSPLRQASGTAHRAPHSSRGVGKLERPSEQSHQTESSSPTEFCSPPSISLLSSPLSSSSARTLWPWLSAKPILSRTELDRPGQALTQGRLCFLTTLDAQ